MRHLSPIVLLIALVLTTLAPPHQSAAQTDQRCFPETGYCISGRIRAFWEQNGGLPVFGFPITPQREELIENQPYQVQWFERERLELHPENAPPYDVLLGRLGADALEQQGRRWQDFPTSEPQNDCRYFEQIRQNVCGDILANWRANGLELDGQPSVSEAESLALFGLPLSPPRTEAVEGREYTVQWFERARFELHPENAPPYNLLLGLLGRSVLTYAGNTLPPQASERLAFTLSEANNNQSIAVVNADGTELTKLTDGSAFDTASAWSPDGTQLAFVSDRDAPPAERVSQQDIYLMQADGTSIQRLTDAPGRDICPAWSPNGLRIAFIADREQTGTFNIYIMNADGSQETRITETGAGCPSWSPDSERLAYVSASSSTGAIFTIRLDGSNATKVGDGGGNLSWSPDGTQLAYERHDGIILVNADGTNDRFLTVGSHPNWSPTGARIAYTSYLSGQGEIHSIRPEGTRTVRLAGKDAPGIEPVWSPSGSQLAFLRVSGNDAVIMVVSADGSREQEIARGRNIAWKP